MELFDIPNGRQVILGVARGLRLSLDDVPHETKVSTSTRKKQRRGERVSAGTDSNLVRSFATALSRQAFGRRTRALAHAETTELQEALVQGVEEFASRWEAAVADSVTFTPSARVTPLVILPFVRLGLLDLALRLQALEGAGLPYLLGPDVETRAREIVDGQAFVACLKAVLGEAGLRRKDLCDRFGEDTVRAWEEGSLPTAAMMSRIVAFLAEKKESYGGFEFVLRTSAALCDLWSWLDERGILHSARVAMAEGFLMWLLSITVLASRESISDEERFMTALFGARHETTSIRLATLSNTIADPCLEADILNLGSRWAERCRVYVAALADVAFAADELRRTNGGVSNCEGVDDAALVALWLCIPKKLFSPRERVIARPTTAEDFESMGTSALRNNDAVAAIAALRESIRLAPSDPWPRIRLAEALHRCGELSEAEAVLRRALALNKEISDAWLLLGGILIDARRPGEALAYLDAALDSSSQKPVVHAYRSAALLALERPSDALEAAEAGIRDDPKNAQCWHLKRRAFEVLGDGVSAALAADHVRHLGGGPHLFEPMNSSHSGGCASTTPCPQRALATGRCGS